MGQGQEVHARRLLQQSMAGVSYYFIFLCLYLFEDKSIDTLRTKCTTWVFLALVYGNYGLIGRRLLSLVFLPTKSK